VRNAREISTQAKGLGADMSSRAWGPWVLPAKKAERKAKKEPVYAMLGTVGKKKNNTACERTRYATLPPNPAPAS
jgi:hypothetical protein